MDHVLFYDYDRYLYYSFLSYQAIPQGIWKSTAIQILAPLLFTTTTAKVPFLIMAVTDMTFSDIIHAHILSSYMLRKTLSLHTLPPYPPLLSPPHGIPSCTARRLAAHTYAPIFAPLSGPPPLFTVPSFILFLSSLSSILFCWVVPRSGRGVEGR
ncbi:hypothetical protein BDQ17DRAFT_1420745 [Cyathus striatus]|nr:hypothetical protein BDQ17DRAFT_1420745 [Cyathus striatus]